MRQGIDSQDVEVSNDAEPRRTPSASPVGHNYSGPSASPVGDGLYSYGRGPSASPVGDGRGPSEGADSVDLQYCSDALGVVAREMLRCVGADLGDAEGEGEGRAAVDFLVQLIVSARPDARRPDEIVATELGLVLQSQVTELGQVLHSQVTGSGLSAARLAMRLAIVSP